MVFGKDFWGEGLFGRRIMCLMYSHHFSLSFSSTKKKTLPFAPENILPSQKKQSYFTRASTPTKDVASELPPLPAIIGATAVTEVVPVLVFGEMGSFCYFVDTGKENKRIWECWSWVGIFWGKSDVEKRANAFDVFSPPQF